MKSLIISSEKRCTCDAECPCPSRIASETGSFYYITSALSTVGGTRDVTVTAVHTRHITSVFEKVISVDVLTQFSFCWGCCCCLFYWIYFQFMKLFSWLKHYIWCLIWYHVLYKPSFFLLMTTWAVVNGCFDNRLLWINISLNGPQENKTLIRFFTDCLRKYIRLIILKND